MKQNQITNHMQGGHTINANKLAAQFGRRYENQWVAISTDTRIVAAGRTYAKTVEKVKSPEEVILLKIPPLDQALAMTRA